MQRPQKKASVIEINLISAQELCSCKSSKKCMQTYVVAWINPKQKLTSRIDIAGNENPTWNDKFIFAIDGDEESSTMVFEIYSIRRFRKDKRIGVVRVLLDSLLDKEADKSQHGLLIKGKFMAFHVRNPSSGTPQGILNMGVMNLDALFSQVMPTFIPSTSLAVDYRRLIGDAEDHNHGQTPKRSARVIPF